MQARGSILVSGAPERAFDFVADAAHDAVWRSYLVSSRGRATAVGDTITQRYSAEGRSFEVTLEVAEFTRPARLGYAIHEPARVRAAFQFRPECEGTRVSMSVSSALTGAALLFESRIQSEAEKLIRADLQRLKVALGDGE